MLEASRDVPSDAQGPMWYQELYPDQEPARACALTLDDLEIIPQMIPTDNFMAPFLVLCGFLGNHI